ncbi:dnaJ homolog subfamily C member 4 [Halictus rubicundus]|uniref:dnaJ homolog subfamily C member 4 n=1 Tax=Halictus rubicundus TaxID=77578 RepID=UPI0040372603
MAQIFRMYKFEVPIIIRHYGNYNHQQRSKGNYYDTLHISTDATQKEIKDAFIKLSKKMHPDCGSEGSHSEFVKINEAYSVLSKRTTKRDYDMSLKYNYTYTGSPSAARSGNYKGPYKTYADWGFVDPSQYKEYDRKQARQALLGCIVLMLIGAFVQFMFIQRSLDVSRQLSLERSLRYEAEYERIKELAKHRTVEEQLQSISDLHENFKFHPRNK